MKQIFKERPWYRLPFIRITLALIVGIMIGNYCIVSKWIVLIGIFTGSILLIGFHFLMPVLKFKYGWIGGCIIHFAFLLVGLQVIQTAKQVPSLPKQIPFRVTIKDPLSKSNRSLKTVGIANNARIQLYFQHDSLASTLKMGTQIILFKKPNRIAALYNPGRFNYQAYAASKHIYYQCYLKKEDYQIIDSITPSYINQLLFTLQHFVLSTIQQHIKGAKEKGIAEALLIGYKKNIDPELLQAYSNTGVVHIIAISGMHLGMIYGLLLFVLSPLSKTKKGNWFKLIIMLLVIWTFTLLTGAAASILRSAIMFSFIIIGQPYQKKIPIYNSIAASAFFILIYEPLQLWDIGFQLSYAAVISIVVFSKPIGHLLFVENKLLRYCWQLTAVTIAAQIGTLPLILFYFHQFPNLFIFSNFIAVPLSGLILYVELFLMLVAPINSIAQLTGALVTHLIEAMNRVIENTARIPFAITQDIQIDLAQTVLLYVTIILISVWLLKKHPPSFLSGLFCIMLFLGMNAFSKINAAAQHKLIVYHLPKKTAIDLLEGRKHRFIGDASIYLQPLQLIAGHHTIVLLINGTYKLPYEVKNYPIDVIILSGNPTISLEIFSNLYSNPQIVFDSSNPMWKIRIWKKEAERLHLRHHSVPEQGAFVCNL